MRDRASVNNVALRTLSIVFTQVFDIGCFSHILDHVGERMKTHVLDDFMKGWIGLFTRSPKTKLAWKTVTGLQVQNLFSYSVVVQMGSNEPLAEIIW